jgi:DHA3 family macrolide efflux protein-like MFS transporter
MTTATQSTSPFAVFRHRNFSLMWTGQLVETIGYSLTSLAASILVFRETGTALSVGLMLIASAAPSLLVGLIAGVYVDRFDRRRIMIIADVLRAVLVFLIPVLVPYGIAWLYVIVLLTSAVAQFFDPAWESVLPEVAPDEELAAANSLMAISTFGSTAIGFAASGLIAANYPISYAFYLNAFAYLFSAGCIYFIQVQKLEATEEKTSLGVVVDNLKWGLEYLFKSPVLRSLFFLAIPISISFGLANTLLLPFATRALNAGEFEYGIQEGLTSVGFVVASLLMAAYMDRWREGQWMVVGLMGMGTAALVYSQLHSIPLAIGVQMLSGFLNAPYAIARRLLVQRNTGVEVRGRVTSSYFVTMNLFFLVGMLAAGLADVIDVRLLYLIGGLATIGCGAWAALLPGVGQPAAEWRRALALLRSAPAAPSLGLERAVLPVDMDSLVGLIPSLHGLGKAERDQIMTQGRILEVEPGTKLVRSGEEGDQAYFVLSGKAVAGIADQQGDYRSLSSMGAGDYFGEIAALTGAPRTADVVAEEAMQLLRVPAEVLRALMSQPAFSQMVLARMTERLARTSLHDLPRFAGVDPQAARDLREAPPSSPQVEVAVA